MWLLLYINNLVNDINSVYMEGSRSSLAVYFDLFHVLYPMVVVRSQRKHLIITVKKRQKICHMWMDSRHQWRTDSKRELTGEDPDPFLKVSSTISIIQHSYFICLMANKKIY